MSDQGKTYSVYIEAELKAERERRSAYDARGIALVTTSGSLVALLAAVVAFIRVGGDLAFPRDARMPLFVALAVLALAAGAGIAASWNFLYQVPKTVTLEKLLGERWGDHELDARNHVGTMQILTIHGLRRGTRWKARLISLGLVAQLLAVIALSVVTYKVLRST